ncbi:hypothetical protein [Nocardioides sp. LML1-1-1.1]|uniref:hypothetical protein n=1 Tax=Nocardioides sp. LML1-1-1.1 TaxID=3135248 RepID=UPI0034434400
MPVRLVRPLLAALLAVAVLTGTPGAADAATARSLTIAASPATALRGTTVALTGRLTRSPKGTPLTVQRKVGARWVGVKVTRTTTKNGTWIVRIAGPRPRASPTSGPLPRGAAPSRPPRPAPSPSWRRRRSPRPWRSARRRW